MSDNVATRKRHRVADPLRLYADNMYANNIVDGPQLNAMFEIADEIDAEHECRMEDCRRETRRATCGYINRVVADYKRGEKWIRKRRGGGE